MVALRLLNLFGLIKMCIDIGCQLRNCGGYHGFVTLAVVITPIIKHCSRMFVADVKISMVR